MDFRLDEEQLELRDAVRRFCAARFGREDLARRDGHRIDQRTWREMAELGVFSLHMLADMYVRTALARSALYAAAAVLDDPGIGDPMGASSAAKLLAGEAAVENARTAIQVHGGMGFTWEMLPNCLLKRAWLLEHVFGNTDSHADAIGSSIEASLA